MLNVILGVVIGSIISYLLFPKRVVSTHVIKPEHFVEYLYNIKLFLISAKDQFNRYLVHDIYDDDLLVDLLYRFENQLNKVDAILHEEK